MSLLKLKAELEDIKRIVERSASTPPDGVEHLLVSIIDKVSDLADHAEELDRRVRTLEEPSDGFRN